MGARRSAATAARRRTPKIRSGDHVEVISGKDRGKTGRVLRVDPGHGRVYVEGLNMVKRHVRPRQSSARAATPEAGQLAPVHAPVEGKRKVRQGVVVSNKAEKTITVRIDVARRHRRYEKIVRSSSTVHAHDENNDAHEGDVVRVIESRPLSRRKRWALVDVLERAQ